MNPVNGPRQDPDAILQVRNLVKTYGTGRKLLSRGHATRAVDGVTFSVRRGTTFGLVGESGSGKSTTARLVCRLASADSGQVLLDGEEVLRARGSRLTSFRRRVQMVFQDPFASLNPRWKVGSLVAEGMRIHGLVPPAQRRERAVELLQQCGLRSDAVDRYPHEFSGGQRQRIGIARALAVEPDLIVLDEPVSALDVSVQAQILTLLTTLQRQLGLTYLFIAHDLAVVERFCDRVAVMRSGELLEEGAPAEVYRNPQHPHTRLLLDAVPVADPRRRRHRSPLPSPEEDHAAQP